MRKILIQPYFIDRKLASLDYLSEGILEELMYLFSNAADLSTAPRSTSIYFKDNPIPLHEIKERFNADFLIEGNVKRKGEAYQVSTRVFDTATEEQILVAHADFQLDTWTQSLDQLVNEILPKIQGNSISMNQLTDTSQSREYYQKGLYHWHRYTYEEMLLAIRFFEKSIQENASFALPYAALADCYSIIGAMGYAQPIPAFELARSFVSKSLLLNNKRADSYVSAALVDIFYDRNFLQAKTNLEQAIKLNGDHVKAHHTLSMYYIHMADFYNAEKQAALTIKLDPLSLPQYTMMIRILIYQKKFQRAMDYVNAAFHIDGQSLAVLALRGYIHLFLGTIDSAIEDFAACVEEDDANPLFLANLSCAYARANFYHESKAMEQRLKALGSLGDTGIVDYAMAIVKMGQKDFKLFFKHAKNAVELNLGVIPSELMCNPLYSEVREDTRFRDMLRQSNLSEDRPTYYKSRKPATAIVLKSQTADTLSIDPQDVCYAEANDNYCTIYWYDTGILKNKMLRLTLKNLYEQLSSFEYIAHCHKSFVINLDLALSITGNAKGHFFESLQLPIRIPISRAKAAEFKARLGK
jgi:TolB-like protein